jgi:hypothetical protein
MPEVPNVPDVPEAPGTAGNGQVDASLDCTENPTLADPTKEEEDLSQKRKAITWTDFHGLALHTVKEFDPRQVTDSFLRVASGFKPVSCECSEDDESMPYLKSSSCCCIC